MNERFSGKTIIITGASAGVGAACARAFATQKANLVLVARGQQGLDIIEKELSAQTKVVTVAMDVSNVEQCLALLVKAEEEFGTVDVLVNNAGRHSKKPSLEATDDEMRAVLETNLVGLFSLTRCCLQRMMARGSGSIINISSMSALFGLPEVAAYSSSKSGLLGLTRTLASEYSSSGVRINAIAPGFIESKMFLEIMEKDPQREARILARTPAGRFGKPEDVAQVAAFLASDASAFITGVCLPVDGGNSIGF